MTSTQVSPRPWWFTWSLTRLLMLAAGYLWYDALSFDPIYYMASLARVGQVGWAGTLPEYPLPVAMIMWPLHLVVDAGAPAALSLAIVLMLVDLLFSVTLARRHGARAVRSWIWGTLLLGPVVLQRLDIVPAVLLALAVTSSRASSSGVLLGLGTAAKVFPIAALPAVVSASPRPWRVIGATTLTGLTAAAVGTAVAGWDRVVSPLTYQSGRGLQVESVPATPFLALQVHSPRVWTTDYSASKSFEIDGPGTAHAADVTGMAQLIAALAILALAVWLGTRLRAPTVELRSQACSNVLLWATIASVGALVVTSRVLSPQYLLWLLPIVSIVGAGGEGRRWILAFMVTLGLSQLVYPVLYDGIVDHTAASWPAALALTARNLMLVALVFDALRRAVTGALALGGPVRRPATLSVSS